MTCQEKNNPVNKGYFAGSERWISAAAEFRANEAGTPQEFLQQICVIFQILNN